MNSEHADETIDNDDDDDDYDDLVVRCGGRRLGRTPRRVVGRTIVRRRTQRPDSRRGRYRVVTVSGRRSGRSAPMDQGRLRAGHQQKPVVPRLPEVHDDRRRRYR